MSKPLRIALLAVALIVLGILALPKGGAPKTGDRFPKWETFPLEGKLPDLAGKVMLVDFWASWCGPCQQAFPSLQKLHETYGPRGLLVLGISVDEKKAGMEEFLKKAGTTFPIVRDDGGKLSEALGLETVPTTYLLSREGRILAIHEGFEGPESLKKLSDDIENALQTAQP